MTAIQPPGTGDRDSASAPIRASALLSVEAARELVLGAITEPVSTETMAVDDALGRVLAAPVGAATDLPPWDNSAMDGYALRAADTAGATGAAPVRLRVAGEVRAGAAADRPVEAGTALRIATGAPLPRRADAVVPIEETTPLGEDGVAGSRGRDAAGPLPSACLVHVAVEVGGAVRRRGDDLRAGTTLLEAGEALGPAGIAIAAGSGNGWLTVRRRPRVAVLATGDEVRPPGTELGPAGIPDANGPGLAALVAAAGGEPVRLGVAADALDDVLARLRGAIAAGVDAIVVSGGVSVGPYDVVKTAFEAIGRMDVWRVAVQPGKPFAFGTAERPDGGQPVLLFGLPGNPVSGFVTFELFVRPAIRRLAGRRDLLRPADRAVLEEPVSKSQGRRAFLRVVSGPRDAQGRVRVRLAGGQGSHVLSALAAADALAVIPEQHDTLPAGAEVELWPLDRP